jgi:predicted O-methyltransferase YrrM
MNAILRRIFETGFTEDAEGNPVAAFPSGVSWDTGSILYRLVREHSRRNTLEIGLAFGLSALFICQAHQDQGGGSHTAIDPYEESAYRSIGLLNARRAGLDGLLRTFPAPSSQVLPRLVDAGEHFDLAFVDGRHHLDYAMVDFFYVDQLLEVDGLVVFDDLWLPAIRRVVSYVLQDRNYALLRVRSDAPRPFWRPAASTALRILQDPLGLDLRVATIPQNIAVLRKLSEDRRSWRMRRRITGAPAEIPSG